MLIKKMNICAALALAISGSLLMMSCGNSKSQSSDNSETEEVKVTTITPESTSISGKLGEAFGIVEKTYKLKKDGVSITIERLSSPSTIKLDEITYRSDSDSPKPFEGEFVIEILDADGDLLESTSARCDDFTKAMNLSAGDKTTLKFDFYKDLPEAASFRISSVVEERSKKESTNGVKETVEEATSSIDKDLEDIDKTVEAASKAAKAATSAISAMKELTK